MVLIDERIDCLPTPRRLGAVLLFSTLWFLSFGPLGQCIQLYLQRSLPFCDFERKQLSRRLLGSFNPSPSRQPYGYLSPRAAAASAGACRRPAGVTERLFLAGRCQNERVVVSSLWVALPRQSQVMPNPLSFTL